MAVLIEACLEHVDDACRAVQAGAGRIEFNRSLVREGLTPSPADLIAVVESVDVPVIAMLRPHNRGFVYSPGELDAMAHSIESLLETGITGIAVGVLMPDGTIDGDRVARLVQLARGREVVFHRAFDLVADPEVGLDLLIELGVTRLLTSGQQASAMQGAATIRHLRERAAGRIEVLPGAGVNPDNIRSLVDQTGCVQVHGSFRDRQGRFDPSALLRARAALDAGE